jgi:hypothetical protein
MRRFLCAPLFAALLLVAGCANVAPVPGGGETVNSAYYQSDDDFKTRVGQLLPGMGESEVLSVLGRTRNDLTTLTRDEIVKVLYGGNSMQMLDSSKEREEARNYLESLYGYHLEYKDVSTHHGFDSPIRIRTTKQGFDYKIDMVFKNGVLMEKPILAGGAVNDSESRTFFDYINPGSLLSRAN